LDGSGYFSPATGAYNQFNIKIGQIETAQVYDARCKFVLPYAAQAWIENEPLQLHFMQYKPKFYDREHQIATRPKKHMKSCLDWLKSDWAISLQINYALQRNSHTQIRIAQIFHYPSRNRQPQKGLPEADFSPICTMQILTNGKCTKYY
jgi:hypothetical protein